MPELPEVETVRRGLERQLGDFTITGVEVLRGRLIAAPQTPDQFCRALDGCLCRSWKRRGKYLLGSLHRGGREAGLWGVHLRMTGQFLWLVESSPPCAHTRMRCWGARGQELRFVDVRSFAQMWWVPPGVEAACVMTGLSRLGPEPFSEAFSDAYLGTRLAGSVRPIKNALLDQSLVAGVGNIYADESLFAAELSPHRRSGSLKPCEISRLRHALNRVLRASIGAGGTTFSDFRDLSGTNGNYGGMAWVYRRAGQPCRRCGQLIQRERLAGRSCHWCPRCQS